jgi:hypothetical protein
VASVTGINEDDLSSFCEDMLSFVRSQGRELKMESIHRHLMIGLDSLADKLVPKGSIKVHGDDPVVHKIISYSICKIDLIYFWYTYTYGRSVVKQIYHVSNVCSISK